MTEAYEKPMLPHTRKERLVELLQRRERGTEGKPIKAWFLGWGIDGSVGNDKEIYHHTVAILEFSNGHVELVHPADIRFLT